MLASAPVFNLKIRLPPPVNTTANDTVDFLILSTWIGSMKRSEDFSVEVSQSV